MVIIHKFCFFQALKHYTGSLGWVLLEVNSNGEIECVTENIRDLIHVGRTELYKKSIFSLLHSGDHAKFKPILRNAQTFSWCSQDIDKFEAIQVRLIKSLNANDGAGFVLFLFFRLHNRHVNYELTK